MFVCLFVVVLAVSEVHEGADPLDVFMSSVGGHLDKAQKTSLKQQLQALSKVRDAGVYYR